MNLRTLDKQAGLYHGHEAKALYKRPIGIVLLSYIVIEDLHNHHQLAKLFWEYLETPELQLKSLADTLRPLKKLAEVIKKGSSNTEIYSDLNADILDFVTYYDQENYQQCLSLYQGTFLEGYQHKKVLQENVRPQLHTWLIGKQAEYSLMALKARFQVAEASARQETFGYAESLWQSYLDIDKTLLKKEDYGRFIHLLELADDERYKQIQRAALAQGFSKTDIQTHQLGTAHNLPYLPTEVLARDEDIKLLDQLLQAPHYRAVSIIGQSGIGKSYLAIEVARRSIGKKFCQEGCYWLSLKDLQSVDSLLPAMLHLMNVPVGKELNLVDYAIRTIGAKAILFVLDNAESLLEVKEILNELLSHCPKLKVLITTQVRLDFDWEHVYWLKGLSVPQSSTNISLVDLFDKNFPALYLFYQSAKRIQNTITFQEEDVKYVVQICQALDGLPLGIKLVTTWLLQYSCQEVAEILAQDVSFQPRPSTDIHKNLYASLAYSWDLFTEQEQEQLAFLSVFASNFDLAAAKAITNIDLFTLQALIEKSFLSKTDRFEFHPLIQQFCNDKLKLDPQKEYLFQEKHAYYYLDEKRRQFLEMPRNQLSYERGNIYKACLWAIENEFAKGIKEATAILRSDGYIVSLKELKALLTYLDETYADEYKLITLCKKTLYGQYYYCLDQFTETIRVAASVPFLANQYLNEQDANEAELKGFILQAVYENLGWAYVLTGDYPKAKTMFLNMFEYRDQATSDSMYHEGNLAYVYCYLGKAGEALDKVHAVVKSFEPESIGQRHWLWSSITLGFVEWQNGNTNQASRRLKALIDKNRDSYQRSLLSARAYLGEALLAEGRLDEALACSEELLELMVENPWTEMVHQAKFVQAGVYLSRHNYQAAWTHYYEVSQGSYTLQLYIQTYRALIGLCHILQVFKQPLAAELWAFLESNKQKITYLDQQWLNDLSKSWPVTATHQVSLVLDKNLMDMLEEQNRYILPLVPTQTPEFVSSYQLRENNMNS